MTRDTLESGDVQATAPSLVDTVPFARSPRAHDDFPEVPGFQLLALIGRGGMGVVFKARQIALNRIVALKMIRPGLLPTEGDLQRFHTEAQATAALRHPHIVSVHEIGQTPLGPFYCMDYIDGTSLAKRLVDGPLPARVAARYLVLIARAVQHAHDGGFLHRDLKPANILLDADDKPHVSDFGLAKRLDDDGGQTQTGAVLGTPSYMAPEQAAGSKALTPATDVYALGAILYELLTGRPPFRASNPMETVRQVLERPPAPPRLVNSGVDQALEVVCLKCLEKDPRRRYPSAGALAADLDRFLAGDSIEARPSSWRQRFALLLEHSQYDKHFGAFARLFLLLGILMFLTEAAINTVYLVRPTEQYLYFLVQTARLFLFAALLWWFRPEGGFRPTSAGERLLWSLGAGYILACILIGVCHRLAYGFTIGPHDEMSHYPKLAALTGMLFFALGSCYWGWCYAFGALFFLASLFMAVNIPLAGFVHGSLWLLVLTIISARLQRLARAAETTD